jgi:hypothetical protein
MFVVPLYHLKSPGELLHNVFDSIPNPNGTVETVPGYKIIFWPALPFIPTVGAATPEVLNEIRLLVPLVNESVDPTERVDERVVAPVIASVPAADKLPVPELPVVIDNDPEWVIDP